MTEEQRVQHAIEKHGLTADPCPACFEAGGRRSDRWLCEGEGIVWDMDTVPCGPDCPLQENAP